MDKQQPVTRLLAAWRDGDAGALEEFTPMVCQALRRLSARHIRRLLINRANARHRLKRGGGLLRAQLDPDLLSMDDAEEHILALHDALLRLEREGKRCRSCIFWRYCAERSGWGQGRRPRRPNGAAGCHRECCGKAAPASCCRGRGKQDSRKRPLSAPCSRRYPVAEGSTPGCRSGSGCG